MNLIKTSLLSAISTAVKIASGFLATKFIAVFAGPPGVALIGQLQNFTSIIMTFANGAITTGVVKYTAEYAGDEEKLQRFISTSLKITLLCSSVIALILIIFSGYFTRLIFKTSEYKSLFTVFGIAIIFFALNTLFLSILNGKNEIKRLTQISIGASIVSLGLTYIFASKWGVYGALLSVVTGQSIVFLITAVMLMRTSWFRFSYLWNSFDRAETQKLLQYTLMTVTSAILAPLSQMFLRDYVMTRLSVESAGHWQGMMRVSEGYLMLITAPLGVYYLPKLSSLTTNIELKKEIFYGYKMFLPLTAITSLAIYLLRYQIIQILFTKEFYPMEELFFFQMLGDVIKIAAWILAYLMLAKAMTKTYIITEVISTVLGVILSILFVNFYGAKGLSYAFALNYSFYLLIMIVVFRKIFLNPDSI